MDSRLMQIADGGAFRGSADIDIAEIRGHFDGSLNVRQRLVVHATGRVHGKIRYGRLVVEEGGHARLYRGKDGQKDQKKGQSLIEEGQDRKSVV